MVLTIFFGLGQGEKHGYYPLCLLYYASYKVYYDISLWPTPPPLNIAYYFSENGMYIFLSATNFKASNFIWTKEKINEVLQSKKY